MIFDVAGNVPDDQVDLIKQGLALAQDYLERVMGGGIPHDVRAGITVKIVNTGLGNQEPGGGGGVATALDAGGIRPFFDVGHVQWVQHLEGFGISVEANILHSVAHEWSHGWQSWLGALDFYDQPLGNAFNEGIAEYLSYAALVDAKLLTWDVVDPFMLNGANQSHELDGPIRDVETAVWPGHAGYLAIEWLVEDAPEGILSLRTLAAEIGAGKSVPDAFRAAFNVELDDFYAQFEAWRQDIVADPANGYENRPALVNIGDGGFGASSGPDDIRGGPLADAISALAGRDHVEGRGGGDTLLGGGGKDTLLGGAGADWLNGGASADALNGNGGSDTLAGGKGKDTLTGGKGKDFFLFESKLGSSGVDDITDFKVKDDTFLLEKDIFTKLGALGTLKGTAFVANTSGKAEDNEDRIIYDEDSGKLYYDANGSRHGGAVLFATIDRDLHLTHLDFVIV
jgi:hypothetical protein